MVEEKICPKCGNKMVPMYNRSSRCSFLYWECKKCEYKLSANEKIRILKIKEKEKSRPKIGKLHPKKWL